MLIDVNPRESPNTTEGIAYWPHTPTSYLGLVACGTHLASRQVEETRQLRGLHRLLVRLFNQLFLIWCETIRLSIPLEAVRQ